MDHSENRTSNPRIGQGASTIGDVIEARLSRRGFLGGMAALGGLTATGCAATTRVDGNIQPPAAFAFEEISRGHG